MFVLNKVEQRMFGLNRLGVWHGLRDSISDPSSDPMHLRHVPTDLEGIDIVQLYMYMSIHECARLDTWRPLATMTAEGQNKFDGPGPSRTCGPVSLIIAPNMPETHHCANKLHSVTFHIEASRLHWGLSYLAEVLKAAQVKCSACFEV